MSALQQALLWVFGMIAVIIIIGLIGGSFDKQKKERELKQTIKNAINDSDTVIKKKPFHIDTSTKIAGVTKKNDGGIDIQSILPTLDDGDVLTFVREPDNPYDKNAIKVICDYQHIGYVKADLAEEIAPLMDEGKTLKGCISEITGGGDKNYGCNIHISI